LNEKFCPNIHLLKFGLCKMQMKQQEKQKVTSDTNKKEEINA